MTGTPNPDPHDVPDFSDPATNLDRLRTVSALALEALVATAMEELDGPHLVVIHDPHLLYTTYTGPYPTVTAALMAAAQEEQDLAEACTDDEPPCQISVVPLSSPHPAFTDLTAEPAAEPAAEAAGEPAAGSSAREQRAA